MDSEHAARMTQLALEYDPAPPFDAGSPRSAGPEITQQALSIIADVKKRTMAIAEKVRARAA